MGIDIIKNWRDFYPRPLRGGRHLDTKRHGQSTAYFYPRPLRGGRQRRAHLFADGTQISIHALCEEGDRAQSHPRPRRRYFYPRPLRGGRRVSTSFSERSPLFLSTPSARRATQRTVFALGAGIFLSTPSARRATSGRLSDTVPVVISIHALCEEGDFPSIPTRALWSYFYPRPLRGGRRDAGVTCALNVQFLSTPSARRATHSTSYKQIPPAISIHALCEEGDGWSSAALQGLSHFYPRPLRGGRPRLREPFQRVNFNFYPRPLRGGRRAGLYLAGLRRKFLSTPSARRATAKTETKSLFSNKLYNILHEFRRALIYNGSKSYPNHAK